MGFFNLHMTKIHYTGTQFGHHLRLAYRILHYCKMLFKSERVQMKYISLLDNMSLLHKCLNLYLYCHSLSPLVKMDNDIIDEYILSCRNDNHFS